MLGYWDKGDISCNFGCRTLEKDQVCVVVSCWLADGVRSFLLAFRGPKWLGGPLVNFFLNQIVYYVSIGIVVL